MFNLRKLLNLQKDVPNHYPEGFLLKRDAQDSDLAHFLEDGSKIKIHSEINPPLKLK